MISSAPYTEISLPGNGQVCVYDHSRIYFGDYYHVRLEVRCEFAGQTEAVIYNRFLEKMAVPSAAVEEVKLALVAEFRRNSLPYLVNPDFQAKYAARTAVGQAVAKKRYATGY